MPNGNHPHILLSGYKNAESYTPKPRRITLPEDVPFFDQQRHGAQLDNAYREALSAAEQQCEQLGIDPAQADRGVAVELRFRAGTKIDVASLENAQGAPIEVLNVKVDAQGRPESALLYVPPGRKDFIRKQIDSYREPEKNTKKGPKNYKKYDKTSDIQPATLEDFWIDNVPLPEDHVQIATWEVWIREGEFPSFREKAALLEQVTVSEHSVNFPERAVCSVRASLEGLNKLEILTKAMSGFRYLRTGGGFFDSMPPAEQQQWQHELSARLTIADDAATSVCLLDTGIADAHPLLAPAIAQSGVDSVDPAAWGTGDHDGHGTEMAGIALLGDLTHLLDGNDDIELGHLLESVKVFPPTGQNKDEHIGYITAQAVNRAEVNRPDLNRVFSLSWGVGHEAQKDGVQVTAGKPTPLSARVDQLAFGVEEADNWRVEDEKKRLLLVSAGNIAEHYDPAQYLDINDLSEIEEPGQSWNALTVGAYTDKVFVNDPAYDDWTALAGPGLLSPKSRTSVLWGEAYWPTKPEIVLEGGNYLADAGGYFEPHPDVSPLSTDKDTVFCYTNDTSAANAEAARLAAILSAQYPNFWPETIRGLMVHSAQWTQAMLDKDDPAGKTKDRKIAFLRRYGYGVPQMDTLLHSSGNRPCIVIQDHLQPFAQSEKGSNIVFKDMNHYELPWPKEQLDEIYDEPVRLRVTLSYFIEPNPSERPPKTKYSYASHELRFRINRPNEARDVFLARINKELQLEEINEDLADEYEINDSVEVTDQDNWLLGPHSRDRGGIISDIWRGTGAELAGQNLIAIVPQQGWWKYRKAFPVAGQARYAETIRYTLILSLISEAEIDLYTPIVQQIETAVAVEV